MQRSLAAVPPPARDLATTALAWMDPWWDADAGLLWNPPGAYEDALHEPRTAHLVRESAWYAAGLLLRDSPGDRRRAARTIEAVASTQYDVPGGVADGTFRRFAEDAVPPPDPVEWVDYDPNWRQFVATTLVLAAELAGDRLPAAAHRTIDEALARAVAGEPEGRVSPAYSNIALMKAWHDACAGGRLGDPAAGRRGAELAAATVARFDRHGTFDEHNSPTYYGIDLYALALWRSLPPSPAMAAAGQRLEAALWGDVAAFYHAGLRNLCGPYDRAYGMDMGAYVADLGLWLWAAAGRVAGPVPSPDRGGPLPHAHDLCMAPVLAALGARVPASARPHLTGFTGERTLRRTVPGDPPRTVTAWLSQRCMAGGADSGGTRTGWSQYHPATVHWALPGGGTGWLRVVHRGVVDAVAAPGALEVTTGPHPRKGPVGTVVELHVGPHPADVDGDRWALPGLDVRVSSDAALAEVGSAGGGLLRARFAVPAHGSGRVRFELRSGR